MVCVGRQIDFCALTVVVWDFISVVLGAAIVMGGHKVNRAVDTVAVHFHAGGREGLPFRGEYFHIHGAGGGGLHIQMQGAAGESEGLGVENPDIELLVKKLCENKGQKFGGYYEITPEVAEEIYHLAL